MNSHELFIGWQIRKDLMCDCVSPHDDEPNEAALRLMWLAHKIARVRASVENISTMMGQGLI